MVLTGLLIAAAWGGEPAAPQRMIAVPAGSFIMGRDRSAHADETPAHQITLSAFFLDARVVTRGEFAAWVDATGYVTVAERHGFAMTGDLGMAPYDWTRTPGANWRQPWGPGGHNPQTDAHPVVQMTWLDATAYCSAHGKRLPTEAEWEYAMRAGSSGTRYPWGDDPTLPDGALGLNYWQGKDHLADAKLDGYTYTSPVGTYPPNAWGFYDPVGNVWQFTADWYAADTFAKDAPAITDPTGPASGWARVARGGSWWCSGTTCSAYGLWARGKQQPDAPYPNNGFRCAMDGR